MEFWSWSLMTVGVFGLWLAGRRNRLGWAVGLGAQTLWVAFALATRQYGFLVSAGAYGWIYARNFRLWRIDSATAADLEESNTRGQLMDNTHEVKIQLNLDNELVRDWFERLVESAQHPIYQNGIRVAKAVEVEGE